MENINVSANALLAALGDLTRYELRALVDNPGRLKRFCAALVAESIRNTFVTPLSDKGVKFQFPRFADRLPPWRRYAATMDYRGPVAWSVKQGFTLMIHAPLAGPCLRGLIYLKDWDFVDTPTTNSLVFWIPRLAEESGCKSVGQMEARRSNNLLRPSVCSSFGSIQLLFALILAHFKRTGERVPLDNELAASDTKRADGCRLTAGNFTSHGLFCDEWNDSVNIYRDVRFFFLEEVKELGQPANTAD